MTHNPEQELLLLSALMDVRLKLEATTKDFEAAKERERVLAAELEQREIAVIEAGFRVEAMQIVLSAALACTGWFGLSRGKFRRMVSEAGRNVPDDGPASVQHHVLLTEARKVLEVQDYTV